MRSDKSKPFLFLTCLVVVVSSLETSNNRNSKHFSLFSVVQFNNEQCTTDATPAGGATTGTCYTSTECSDKDGVSAGRCASGFGVCCTFINRVEALTSEIMENRTRLRNYEYPDVGTGTTTAAKTIEYTINKMQSDICQIRLDFTTFVLAGPINAQESIGTAPAQTTFTHCSIDTFQITTTGVPNAADTASGVLCGALTGEHLYVELSPTDADTATVTLAWNPLGETTDAVAVTANTANAARIWDIQVSQIECFSAWRAPAGCDRYMMADAGQITSFNFVRPTTSINTGIELAAQRIKTCIRRSKGMCCVEYQVCSMFNGIALADTQATHTTPATIDLGVGSNDATGSVQFINDGWSLDTNTAPFILDTPIEVTPIAAGLPVIGIATIFSSQINIGMVDAQCSGDYVEIPSSWSGGCGSTHGSARNTINSRYCGARFGANWQGTARSTAVAPANLVTTSTPVCDCSEPFVVRHNSDTVSDLGGTGGSAIVNLSTARPRGFCLDFRQMPCWQ